MTNKLPEIGKKYRSKKECSLAIKVTHINHGDAEVVYEPVFDWWWNCDSIVDFWDRFKEVPSKESTSAENAQVDKVQKPTTQGECDDIMAAKAECCSDDCEPSHLHDILQEGAEKGKLT